MCQLIVGAIGEHFFKNKPTGLYLKLFFWDGRASSLEEQMQGPLFSEHEMGNSPESLVKTLNNIPAYRHLFLQAFPKKNKNQ